MAGGAANPAAWCSRCAHCGRPRWRDLELQRNRLLHESVWSAGRRGAGGKAPDAPVTAHDTSPTEMAKGRRRPQLRVHGIDGLRVIDASVMPTIASGNINPAVLMIGENGADFVKGRTAPSDEAGWSGADTTAPRRPGWAMC